MLGAVAVLAASGHGGATAPTIAEASYGRDPAQTLDLIVPAGHARPPLILWVHGGGWMIGDKDHAVTLKRDHFVSQGYAFAALNYRLVPNASVEQQAADLAAALAWLRAHAGRAHYDPNRIILLGHSAGAHLAALVGTDPGYLRDAGVPMSSIKGIVLLDGAGYDIRAQMAQPRYPVKRMYEAAFGRDPARQMALSPTHHVAAPNVASWLILPVADREDSVAQSNSFAQALNAAGASARVTPVPDSSHAKINRGLGGEGDFATQQVDRFIASLR